MKTYFFIHTVTLQCTLALSRDQLHDVVDDAVGRGAAAAAGALVVDHQRVEEVLTAPHGAAAVEPHRHDVEVGGEELGEADAVAVVDVLFADVSTGGRAGERIG